LSAALLLAVGLAAQGPESKPPSPAPAATEAITPTDGAEDRTLLAQVGRVASQVESLRGRRFSSPPSASRVPAAVLDAAVQGRAQRLLAAARVAARGRAWADLGLGSPETPARLLLRIASDLPGIFVDPGAGKVLLGPGFLTDRDFAAENPDDPESVIFMAVGVRPDEPLLAHALVHLQERGSGIPPETTDRLLSRAAWSEGEANLLAIQLVFRSMGIGNEVFQSEVDPSRVLGGRLLGASAAGLPAPERSLLDFVHQEGFAQAVLLFRKGGWTAVQEGSASRTTTRDLLHPDRPRPAVARAQPASPPVADISLADEDELGEQGVIALVSTLTGKDDLALAAGDGWAGDSLQRWERPDGQGVTVWETSWGTEEDAEEFAYALGRCVEDGLAGIRFEAVPPGTPHGLDASWQAAGRVYRLSRTGRRAVVRVAAVDLDRLMDQGTQPQKRDTPESRSRIITKP